MIQSVIATIKPTTLEVLLKRSDMVFKSNISPIAAHIFKLKTQRIHSIRGGMKIKPIAISPNAPMPDFNNFTLPDVNLKLKLCILMLKYKMAFIYMIIKAKSA